MSCAAKLCGVVGACVLASSALGGGSWTEVGDAGQTVPTAQITLGTGTLKLIDGELVTGDDADIYCIRITNVSQFYANSGASFDAQLFLFTMSGVGIAMADQNGGGGQAILDGTFVPAPGDYLLAISRYNNDPIDFVGDMIWNNTPRNVQRAPDGPSATDVLFGWNDGGPANGGKYKLDLKGVEYCPTPGAASALIGMLCVIGGRSRRR